MPPLPADLLVPMLGVVGGLLLFAGLLQLGTWIVRLLRLPNDLPEGPHFEPSPPPSRDVLDRTEARRIAEGQARLHRLYGRARSAAQAAQLCAELAAQDYPAVEGAPDPATARADLARLATQARTAAETLDQAVRKPDADDAAIKALATTAEAAATEAAALAARYPSGRARRLRLMLIVLVVVILWTVMMHLGMPRVR